MGPRGEHRVRGKASEAVTRYHLPTTHQDHASLLEVGKSQETQPPTHPGQSVTAAEGRDTPRQTCPPSEPATRQPAIQPARRTPSHPATHPGRCGAARCSGLTHPYFGVEPAADGVAERGPRQRLGEPVHHLAQVKAKASCGVSRNTHGIGNWERRQGSESLRHRPLMPGVSCRWAHMQVVFCGFGRGVASFKRFWVLGCLFQRASVGAEVEQQEHVGTTHSVSLTQLTAYMCSPRMLRRRKVQKEGGGCSRWRVEGGGCRRWKVEGGGR